MQTKTRSRVSLLSPHKTQPCWILQVIILSPVDNLFFTASHTINDNRRTVWENQTFLLQNTVAFFTLIWSPSPCRWKTSFIGILWMLPDHQMVTKRVIRHLFILNAIVKGVEVPASTTSNVSIWVQNCITHPHIASYSKVRSANKTSDIYKLPHF